jgi:GDP-4-dehydro-6-deoxy-D-mannose reductase
VDIVSLELREAPSVVRAAKHSCDAVVHLAAVASGGEALRDPGTAWEVNAAGTARLVEALGAQWRAQERDPVLLLVSTAEVYGAGAARPRSETDPTQPCSPYAASKLAGEIAAMEVHRRTGLRVMIARAFAHTGPGQDDRFAVPAFAKRLVAAKRSRATAINVGNLEPVRELLHVSDVVRAYVLLLERGKAGEVYNVASGTGIGLRDMLDRMMEVVGHRVAPQVDPLLLRPTDIPHLVGDPRKLEAATGWSPRFSLDETLRDVVNAQAN